MSSDVITQENCARLHVARRVRDIAKSMIRLSTLGRSIVPILVLPEPGSRNPRFGLRFRRGRAGGFAIPPQRLILRRPRWPVRVKTPPTPTEAPRVSVDQVAAFRLARH